MTPHPDQINIPFMCAIGAGIFACGVWLGLWIGRKRLQLARRLKTAANAEIRACQWIERELERIEGELELTTIRLADSDAENIKLRKGILQMAAEANLAASLSDAQSRLG